MKKHKTISYDRLHEVLDYNAETGVFRWKTPACNRVHVGDVAGSKSRGYINIRVDGASYLAHRLAWLYKYGYLPENQIDHINRLRSDNRIKNLREASPSCNLRNSKIHIDNTSGVRGVSWHSRRNKWQARIRVNYKQKHLGFYTDIGNAACARLAAEQCLGWSDCDSTSSAYLYIQKLLCK